MDVKTIIEYIKSNKDYLENNQRIFEILEGNLSKYLNETLENQLSGDSARISMQRSAPINVLIKIVKKLSKLYAMPVERTASKPSDQELIDFYEEEIDLNVHYTDANEAFNSSKSCALEMYAEKDELKVRSLPPFQFIAYSDDPVNPMNMTHFIKIMPHKEGEVKFWIYTKEEFMPVDKDGNIIVSDLGDTEGLNPYGVIPFSYLSKSRYLLTPLSDTDTLRMTLLIPVLLTDLNFASLMLSNPILYTVDADGSNIKISPNMYWDLKSDSEGKKPEIGVIKPEPNIDAILQLIKEELGMWMQTRNIKPGSVIGNAQGDNPASGVALMIENMDTTEDRKNQETYFKAMESDFWYKFSNIHNYLASSGELKDRRLFSNELKVSVKYAEQVVMETRLDMVNRLKIEVDAGFKSKHSAIKELNPDMTDEEIDKVIEEMKVPIMIRMDNGATESDDTNSDESNI